MIEHKPISPAFLKQKGFKLYIPGSEDEFDPFPATFDIEFGENDLCYLEEKFDRKMFCIVLTPCEYTDGEKYFRFEIYIQDDVGCGFVKIPNQFTEMTEYHFCLLYEGVRREPLREVSQFDIAVSAINDLTDDERMEIFRQYCKYCGSNDPKCQCENDD